MLIKQYFWKLAIKFVENSFTIFFYKCLKNKIFYKYILKKIIFIQKFLSWGSKYHKLKNSQRHFWLFFDTPTKLRSSNAWISCSSSTLLKNVSALFGPLIILPNSSYFFLPCTFSTPFLWFFFMKFFFYVFVTNMVT